MTRMNISGRTGTSTIPEAGPSNDNADSPLPSIEGGAASDASDIYSVTNSSISRLRTPSVSITPPPTASSHRSTESQGSEATGRTRNGTPQSRSDSHGIDAALGQMRLASPDPISDLSDVAVAIDAVARGADTREQTLDTEESSVPARTPSPRRGPRGRRSSSRVMVLRYDVRNEPAPVDAFNAPTFQHAFREAKRLMSTMAGVLSSSSLHDDPDTTMHRLQGEARDLAGFQHPSTRKVGFVGDSGVGKSSLLNSLLDKKSLARTSNSGEACTCVVTEYHHHDDDGFAIEVELFTMDEITEHLKEMLQSYRHFHSHEDEMDSEDRKDFEEKADRAQDTFHSMFRNRMNDSRFLLDQTEAAALRKLTAMATESRPSSIGARSAGLTLKTCSALLMGYSSEKTAAGEPAIWPYIRKIKVFSNAYILSKGLILVDLPGLRDLNSARRIITERFLLECDEIFVVCNIGRAVTDAGVESVFELARQARLSNVGIVCTRSDDIQADEARKDWTGPEADHVNRLMDAVATDRRDFARIEAELSELTELDDLSEGEKEEENDLNRQKRNAESRLRQHRFQLKTHLMTTRSTKVTAKLQAHYHDKVPDVDLKIFCVSNKDYWDHREDLIDPTHPVVNLSGVSAVRKHCISIVSNSQHRIASRYMNDDIPALLAQVELWVQSGASNATVERRAAIRESLGELERRLRRDLMSNSALITRIAKSIKTDFKGQIYDRRRVAEWSAVAKNAAYEWSAWSHPSYSAFCRNFGDHSTGKVGSHNWNEEAIQGMVDSLKTPWQDLRAQIEDRQDSVSTLVEGLTEWAIEFLDTNLEDEVATVSPLTQALVTRQHLFIANMQQAYDEFENDLSTLRTDALSGIRSSFIGKALEDSYQVCRHESGTGSDARRKATMNQALGRDTLFENLMKAFRDSLGLFADKLQTKIIEATTGYLDVVRGTLDIVRSDNIALESEQEPEFRERVQEGVTSIQSSIQRVLAEINH